MNVIMKVDEIAKRLGKSKRWVYAHGYELGGVKIGGTWIFTLEGFRDAIQGKRQRWLARSGAVAGKDVSRRFRNEKRGGGVGGQEKARAGGLYQDAEPDRHGLGKFLR